MAQGSSSPSSGGGAVGVSGGGDGASSCPEMRIVLFNVGQKKYKTAVDVEPCMESVLQSIVADYPLFVLCQDKIDQYKHEALLKQLKFDHDTQKTHAGVYHSLKGFDIASVDLENVKLEKMAPITMGNVDQEAEKLLRDLAAHMDVCVVTLKGGHRENILLVAWDGPQDDESPSNGGTTDTDRQKKFSDTFDLLDRLKETEKCIGVVVGGNFRRPEVNLSHLDSDTRCDYAKDKPYTVVYWPKSIFQFSDSPTHNDHDIVAYTCEVQRTQKKNKLTISLFNMQSSSSQEQIEESTKKVIEKLAVSTPSLFVLCTDIDEQKRAVLRKELQPVRPEKKKEVEVYYSSFDQYGVTYVSEDTLKKVEDALNTEETNPATEGEEYFTTDRLMACVLTPAEASHDKTLLVSWHGPNNKGTDGSLTTKEKKPPFQKLVRYLDSLKRKMECKSVVVGGDFNLPYYKAEEYLAEMNKSGEGPVLSAVYADYEPTDDRKRKDEIDYIVLWPKDKCKKDAHPEAKSDKDICKDEDPKDAHPEAKSDNDTGKDDVPKDAHPEAKSDNATGKDDVPKDAHPEAKSDNDTGKDDVPKDAPAEATDDSKICKAGSRVFDHDIISYTLKAPIPTPELTIEWPDDAQQHTAPRLTCRQGPTQQNPESPPQPELDEEENNRPLGEGKKCLELKSFRTHVRTFICTNVLVANVEVIPGTDEVKAFKTLVDLLDHLKEKEECHVVLLSGNLGLSYKEAQECLEEMKYVRGEVLTPDAQGRPVDPKQPYCVSWPRDRIKVREKCPLRPVTDALKDLTLEDVGTES